MRLIPLRFLYESVVRGSGKYTAGPLTTSLCVRRLTLWGCVGQHRGTYIQISRNDWGWEAGAGGHSSRFWAPRHGMNIHIIIGRSRASIKCM